MVNRLKLSGNKLVLYAVIYGFSQDKKSGYEGGCQYLCDSCGASRRAVTDVLNSLLKDKYILKEYFTKNNVKFCRYKTNPDLVPNENRNTEKKGTAESAEGGMAEFAAGVRQNLPQGMAESACNTTAYINLNITSPAPSSEPHKTNEETLPAGKKAAEALFTPEELKKELLSADKRLFLKNNFYARAPVFMSKNGLDLKYFSWLCQKCENMNYTSFAGLFYSLFFEDNNVDEYRASLTASPKPSPPVYSCPSCGAPAGGGTECRSCGLHNPLNAAEDDILFHKKLHEFPPEKRNEYLAREDGIISLCGNDFEKLNIKLTALKREFGLTVGP
jgi:hypothetical protein